MKTESENILKSPSFRPSQNADGISENHHAGINRLVKLSIVIEGKVIKYYKHFKLTQSTGKHHEFSLTLAHDALGDRQTHTLEEANKFLDHGYHPALPAATGPVFPNTPESMPNSAASFSCVTLWCRGSGIPSSNLTGQIACL